MSSIWMHKRGLNTKTFASTNTSYNKAKNVFWRANWTHPSMSIVVIYKLQMTYLRLEFICRLHGCIEEVWVLRLLISPMYHTITSFKCALIRHSLLWLWLSSVVIYELHTTLPRLELICCLNWCIEEIRWLQLDQTSINCTIQALNVSWRGHWIWPKLSIIVIVRSLLDIFFAVADILSTWIYRRAMNTWTCLNTHILHNTLALLHPDDSGLIWWKMKCLFNCYICDMLRVPKLTESSARAHIEWVLRSWLMQMNLISTKTRLPI